jgi:hypothetical protein
MQAPGSSYLEAQLVSQVDIVGEQDRSIKPLQQWT